MPSVDSERFQSTLSVRRATHGKMPSMARWIFQSTLSVRRATRSVAHFDVLQDISIHALRKESDRH